VLEVRKKQWPCIAVIEMDCCLYFLCSLAWPDLLNLLKEKRGLALYETILYVILIKTQHAIYNYTIKWGDMPFTFASTLHFDL